MRCWAGDGVLALLGMEFARVVLPTTRFTPAVSGPAAALYVMVSADARFAKVGALESAGNAVTRVRSVERHHRARHGDPGAYPLRLVVVGEIDGLVVGRYHWCDGRWVYDDGKEGFDQRWAEVEHLESAVRLSLARRVGGLAGWADWIRVDRPPLSDEAWLSEFHAAWLEADHIGGPSEPAKDLIQPAVDDAPRI